MSSKVTLLRVAVATVAALAGLAGTSSCQTILGEVQIVNRDLDPLGQDAGTPSTACRTGALRCVGALRQICMEFAPGQGSEWVVQEDCTTAALCNKGISQPVATCERKACDFDAVKCEAATPQRCNAELTQWDSVGEACNNAGECSTDPLDCPNGTPCCSARGCTPGDLRCNQNVLQRCSADSSDWDVVSECVTAELCAQGLSACGSEPAPCGCAAKVCDPGQTRCTGSDGTTLEVCNDAQDGWKFVDTCATAALCNVGAPLVPPRCEPPHCSTEIDEHRCDEDGRLERCRENRTGFDVVRVCEGGAAFCNAAERRCELTPCSPGDRRCNGAVIEVCRDNRSGFDPSGEVCATSVLCQNTPPPPHCNPPACAAEQFSCFGANQLFRCNDDRTGFVTVGPPCARADLCSAERRRCDFCVPSRRECTPDLRASRTCNASGTAFGPLTPCPGGCISETGACRTCTIGEYLCQGGNLARCNDGQVFSALNLGATCDGAERISCQGNEVVRTNCGSTGCNTSRNDCNDCTGSERRCVSLGGSSFQTCDGQGRFGAPEACPADFACEGNGDCRCSTGARRCQGGAVFACSLDRTAFELSEVCGANLRCEEPRGCVCTPGAVRCVGGDLEECNGAGNAFAAVADRCDGNVLRFCRGNMTAVDECLSARHCQQADGNTCPNCLDDSDCEPDEICNTDIDECEPAPEPEPEP
jgi:hypothetical protein